MTTPPLPGATLPPEASFVNPNDPIVVAIIVILGISTIIQVLDSSGFLPRRAARWLARNRLGAMLDVLKELGIDVDQTARANRRTKLPHFPSGTAPSAQADEMLKAFRLNKSVSVGGVQSVLTANFINLMGATVDPATAISFARLLASYWRDIVADQQQVPNWQFDYVLAPKEGSVILAYEFARIVQKPLVLYDRRPKFEGDDLPFEKFFDASSRPPAGARALLVDDSTTGGGKMRAAALAWRQCGYDVSDCLVVFEPTIKNARGVLKAANLNLHAVTKT